MSRDDIKLYRYRVRSHLMEKTEQSPWLGVGADSDFRALQAIAFRHSQQGKHEFELLNFAQVVCDKEKVMLEFDVCPITIRNTSHVIVQFDFTDAGFLTNCTMRQIDFDGSNKTEWTVSENLDRPNEGPIAEEAENSDPKPKPKPFMKEVINL